MTRPSAPRIPENRVSSIMARAAQLDREISTTVQLETIRAAAVEAGISEAAVDKALAEFAGHETPAAIAEPAPKAGFWQRTRHSLGRALTFGALATITGLLGFVGEGGMGLGLLLFGALNVYLIGDVKRQRSLGAFQLAATLMTVGGGFTSNLVDEDFGSAIIVIGIASLVAGSIILAIRSRHDTDTANATDPIQPASLHS